MRWVLQWAGNQVEDPERGTQAAITRLLPWRTNMFGGSFLGANLGLIQTPRYDCDCNINNDQYHPIQNSGGCPPERGMLAAITRLLPWRTNMFVDLFWRRDLSLIQYACSRNINNE